MRIWAPTGESSDAADDPEAEPLALASRNQDRMHEEPQLLRGLNPGVLDALAENPELLDLLLRRAVHTRGGGGPSDAAVPPEIACRVN